MGDDLKKKLWAAADKLRAQMDAAEYKHIVLGLIFLKYISDTFVSQQNKVREMVSDRESDYFVSEDPAEYKIKDEVKTRFRTNVVKQRKFSELLEKSLGRYANRAIEAAQVIEELIEMAKQFKKDLERRVSHNLSPEEEAFYDALAQNESAQELMGEEVLVEMAREVAKKLRENLTVDWAVRDSVRARLRILIRQLLRKYKYPPDQQPGAVKLVLTQAERLSEEMVFA